MALNMKNQAEQGKKKKTQLAHSCRARKVKWNFSHRDLIPRAVLPGFKSQLFHLLALGKLLNSPRVSVP